jgi:phosphate transport system substrate-binding protein
LIVVCAFAPAPVLAQQKIVIDGSTGTAPLVAALGKAFADRKGIAVEIGKGLGTRARFDALASGNIDIAMASHGLKIDEVTRRGMTVHRIAKAAVVFAAHVSAKVANLTEAQVCGIYEGRHTNWKDLGGADLAAVAHVRPDSEVDTEVIRDGIACLKAMKFPAAVKVMERSGDMARALGTTPGAFGVTSATVVQQSQNMLVAISIGGVTPDEANVIADRYRLRRDAFLVIRPDGATIIRANGAIAAK